MKYLYKYPHAAFPYTNLVAENRRRRIAIVGLASRPTATRLYQWP
jgi:hypothetical protein